MIIKNILLNLLAIVAILSSVLVITAKNPVISVLFLISVFINTAGYLILTGIGFVGIAYILVYIGAITVLFLFVIMMINIKLVDILEIGKEYTKNLPLALSIGFVFLYLIFAITSSNSIWLESYVSEVEPYNGLNNISLQFIPLYFLNEFNELFSSSLNLVSDNGLNNHLLNFDNNVLTSNYNLYNHVGLDINFINFLHIEMLGQGLYTYGAYWLILSSIILLLSMIAPIILSTPSSNNE